MLGFILGAACVFGFVRMMRRRAWFGRHGYGGCGGPGFGPGFGPGQAFYGPGAMGPFGGARGRRGFRMAALRGLFERLETTPGQERAIVAALDELQENRRTLREELGQTRADVARAIAGGLIEDSTLEETYARQDRLLARLRVSFNEALKKVAEALDESQRKELASMLEGRSFRGGWGGGTIWA